MRAAILAGLLRSPLVSVCLVPPSISRHVSGCKRQALLPCVFWALLSERRALAPGTLDLLVRCAPLATYDCHSRCRRSRGALRTVVCALVWLLRSASPSELDARLADGMGRKPQPPDSVPSLAPPRRTSWRHVVCAASSASASGWLPTTRSGCAALAVTRV